MTASQVVWEPDEKVASDTRMAAFMRHHGIRDLAALLRRADSEPQWYWGALLYFFDIRFFTPYTEVLDLSLGPAWPRWCVGGTTNVALNCLDRHRGTATRTKPAIIFEGEDGTVITWTYAQLDGEVCRLATCLRPRGIVAGDVVGLFMPMIPEAAATFLAVVKIGAVVMPLFSGFGPGPISARLNDATAVAVITADIGWRRGTQIAMLKALNEALKTLASVHTVVVLPRVEPTALAPDRDVLWPSSKEDPPDTTTQIVDAKAPVMLIYTSGTTGKPKGTIHSHCGVLAENALDMGRCIDLKADDRLLWMSDMGWIVGPKIVVSATLLGATLVMAEGTPDWPNEARMWRLVADHEVSIVGIVPTMVRQMMRRDTTVLKKLDLSKLRATISIGEPWTPDAWLWFFENICQRRIPILNYAGGTECGGAILISSFLQKLRPCAFGHAVPSCGADVVDANGRSLPPAEMGELFIRRPSIGMTRGLWRAPERYLEEYWNVILAVSVQGDLASRDADGLWYLHGRSDDPIKISGKRTGPAEIETALLATGLLAHSAVIGLPDPATGSVLAAVCVPASTETDTGPLARQLANVVGEYFGKSYRPMVFVFVTDLPKTRNTKIMRRVICSALTGQSQGDLSSLSNPGAVQEIYDAPHIASDTSQLTAAPRSRPFLKEM